jgi:uncharacterized protein YegP (UPF0339 family)
MQRRTFCLTLASALAVASMATVATGAGNLKFEVYKDKASEFRFRIKAGNGKVLATSGEGYKAKADALKAIETLQKDAAALTFEVYEDKAGEHRFRIKAQNGQVLAASSEGYKKKADAEKAAERIRDDAKDAKVDDDTK